MKLRILHVCCALSVASVSALAQPITSFRLAPAKYAIQPRKLWVTANGQEKQVTATAINAWKAEDGRVLLWAGPDGAGGFENEGQSLWRYEASTGKQRKIMAEYFPVHSVREVPTKSGYMMYVVTMFDGGLGAPHVAVVDPRRGEVWRHTVARIAGIRNGRIAVAVLKPQEVAETTPAGVAKIPVRRMLYLDLDTLRRRPVMHLKRFS